MWCAAAIVWFGTINQQRLVEWKDCFETKVLCEKYLENPEVPDYAIVDKGYCFPEKYKKKRSV